MYSFDPSKRNQEHQIFYPISLHARATSAILVFLQEEVPRCFPQLTQKGTHAEALALLQRNMHQEHYNVVIVPM